MQTPENDYQPNPLTADTKSIDQTLQTKSATISPKIPKKIILIVVLFGFVFVLLTVTALISSQKKSNLPSISHPSPTDIPISSPIPSQTLDADIDPEIQQQFDNINSQLVNQNDIILPPNFDSEIGAKK